MKFQATSARFKMYRYIRLNGWLNGKECRRPRFDLWVGKIPWRKEELPTSVFLPGESHRHRSLVGYSPWDHESQTWLRNWAKHIYICMPPYTHAHNIVVTSLFSDDFWNSPYHIAVRKVTTDIFHHNLYLSGFKVNPLKSNLCYCSRHHWSDVCSMECRRQSSFLICLECYTPGCALWRIQTAPSFTFILEAYGRCLKMTVAAIRGYRMM